MQRAQKLNFRKNILINFIVFSVVLHLLALFVHLKETQISADINKVKAQKLLVQLLKKSKATQIVQIEASNKIKSEKTKFLGKADNTVLRETKNKNIGIFNSAAIGSRSAQHKKNTQAKKSKKLKTFKNLKFSDLAVKAQVPKSLIKKKERLQVSARKKGLKNGKVNGKLLGQSSDYLEDIKLGDFTQLNTQEYEFYGFYDRIRQKLEQFWGNNLRAEADKLFKQGRSIASDNNLITGLTIQINAKGKIVDIKLKSTSGMKELDDAAVKSFNQAGPFPNPPVGMLKSDGRAVIEWGFVVNT